MKERRSLVIMCSWGRLGNQLFQYSFLAESAKSGDVAIFFGANELREVLKPSTSVRLVAIKSSRVLYWFRRVFTALATIAQHFSLWAVIEQECTAEHGRIDRVKKSLGLAPVVQIMPGFFQSAKMISANVPSESDFQDQLQVRARQIIDSFKKVHSERNIVFVHVRRGDYLTWSVLGKSNPSLPIGYYRHAMALLQEHFNNDIFWLVVGDDPQWLVDATGIDSENSWVSKESAGIDLLLMAFADGGIMSNSTLCWWGSKLGGRVRPLVCPEHWLGFKSKRWYPIGVRPPFATDVVRVPES